MKILNPTHGSDIVDYNVKPPVGGLEGLNEFDVIGLDFKNKIAYLVRLQRISGVSYIRIMNVP